jgi:hypothetical protein
MKHILKFLFYILILAFIIIMLFIFGLIGYIAFTFQNYMLAIPLFIIVILSVISLIYCLYLWLIEK